VSIYEVSPRDGLQNEAAMISLEGKKRLLDGLIKAGLRRIEITSFVSPKWVPQLADAEELAREYRPPPGVTFGALCPNAKGLERALAAGLTEIAVFLSSSETHNKMNINKTIDDTLAVFEEIVPPAREKGLAVRAYLSTVWGCPYEGNVDPKKALSDLEAPHRAWVLPGLDLGDTIGVGTPRQTDTIVRMFRDEMPLSQIALHLHDTRGTALANILTRAPARGARLRLCGGRRGGLSVRAGRGGNVATEDLVYLLNGMGVRAGSISTSSSRRATSPSR
jgi:hydroxymethylglutaryl-CoA lyase